MKTYEKEIRRNLVCESRDLIRLAINNLYKVEGVDTLNDVIDALNGLNNILYYIYTKEIK